MWILMMMLVTSDGQLVMYDQGIFETMDECISTKASVEKELSETEYGLTCFRWEDYGQFDKDNNKEK